MKTLLWIVVVVAAIIGAVLIFSPRAPENVQQATIGDSPTGSQTDENTQNGDTVQPIAITSFGFTGYGPGKSHVGTFNQYEVSNVAVNGNGVPTAGTVTFFVDSITTDTDMLTEHLTTKKEFLDSATYPTITFALADVTDMGEGTFQVNGDLTVKGTMKRIGFPVQAKADKTFTSEFRVDMSAFGFSAPGIVDKEVLINFSGNVL
jgi:polyisoprenoid-binding protein YceI